MSLAEAKNVAGRAQKCRQRSPQTTKKGRTKILCRRSPTTAGGLFVLIALILLEVKKYRDSGAIVAVS